MDATEGLNLRHIAIPRDEEDTDADHAAMRAQDLTRLDMAADLAGRSPGDLVARLRAPKSTQLGQQCAPFHPKIHLDAADAIEELENETTSTLTNEQIANLAARLMGFYPVGPLDSHGVPEFGFRRAWTDEIGLEAAGRICALAPDIGAALGVGAPPPRSAPGSLAASVRS